MALRDLSVQSMIAITHTWLDPQKDRPLLESHPPVAGVLGALDEAHDGLLSTQRSEGAAAEQIEALSQEITGFDQHHDRNARGLYKLLEGRAELAEDPAEAEALYELRDKLFPEGLSINNASYLSEAGNVRMVEERLTPEVRQKLSALQVGGRTFEEVADGWIASGVALGEAFTKRSRLEQRHDPQAISAGDVHQARLTWIRTVKALLAVIDLVGLDEQAKSDLLTPLNEAMRQAEKPEPVEPVEPVVEEV